MQTPEEYRKISGMERLAGVCMDFINRKKLAAEAAAVSSNLKRIRDNQPLYGSESFTVNPKLPENIQIRGSLAKIGINILEDSTLSVLARFKRDSRDFMGFSILVCCTKSNNNKQETCAEIITTLAQRVSDQTSPEPAITSVDIRMRNSTLKRINLLQALPRGSERIALTGTLARCVLAQ